MSKRLKSLREIVNSVSEHEYRTAINNPLKVLSDWDKFKVDKGGGRFLTMITDIDPRDRASNSKIGKNRNSEHLMIRQTHQMSMALAQADSSGVFEACHGCRTKQCSLLCNARSGHMRIEHGTAERAKKIRSMYWAENPQFAGALAVIESRKGALLAGSLGLIPIIRSNTWSDVPWYLTTLAGPWIHDFTQDNADFIGLAAEYPMLSHSNYTKHTASRNLKPGEKEPDEAAPPNYYMTLSINENTPVARIRARIASGRTAIAVVWATPNTPLPQEWTMVDRWGKRETFPCYNANLDDARIHDAEVGRHGVGLLTKKTVNNLPLFKGMAEVSSFIRPIDPDAPVGSKFGIPKEYAKSEHIRVGTLSEEVSEQPVQPARSEDVLGDSADSEHCTFH